MKIKCPFCGASHYSIKYKICFAERPHTITNVCVCLKCGKQFSYS